MKIEIIVNSLLWSKRKKRKMAISKISKLTGIPKSTLYRIENNETIPKIDQLILLSIVLRVDIKNLYEINFKKTM